MQTRSPIITSKARRMAKKGKKIYDQLVGNHLESRYKGEYIAIEVQSKDYFIGGKITEAIAKAREKYPEKEFYVARIGYPATASFKHKTSI